VIFATINYRLLTIGCQLLTVNY